MLALILDSLGSTELLFIMVIALIFFGPRKLPQLARSMGKGLAEFRKASEDFKRTWEREVALESARTEPNENSILPEVATQQYSDSAAINDPVVEPADTEQVVARDGPHQRPLDVATTATQTSNETKATDTLRKHDWL